MSQVLPAGSRPLPSVSVIVCTRDRAESCRDTLARLLESRPTGCQVVVVDQSRGEDTRLALADLARADDFVYLQSASRGLSSARNEGAENSTGDLLLFTDDDCLPDADWIQAWRDCFAADQEVGVGFGQVSCPPFDPTKGYTAGFNARDGSHGREIFRLGAGHVGMGANMVVRRRVWLVLGGFDEGLGAGSRFPAGEDADLAYRALKNGYPLRHLTAARVWHYGYRPGSSASLLMRGYVVGIAAMYAKHARCGDGYAVRLLGIETWHHVIGVVRRLLNRTRPLGLIGLLYFLRGVGWAWTSPLDTRLRLYGSKDGAHAH